MGHIGLVTISLPVTVVSGRRPVGSRHVEPVLTTLAVGSVHMHLHVITGESTVRTTGRDSASEHIAVVIIASTSRS